ncbi:MAG: hypothetical protein AUJ54_06810 [Ignavibacteria bacterium CG1_02_37_35]|nr:MAG: hypothetical protein AUJ54_06810 [Ignavibacteria bacterium CG1_02_37_35]
MSSLIIRQIEKAILDKKYLPGAKLPSEFDLCNQFGVSRTSVREALGTLEAQGLIVIQKGRGMFVNKLSSDTVTNSLRKYLVRMTDRNYVMDLVHARQILEPAIAFYAALNHNDDDIKRLEEDINKLKICQEDYTELANIDTLFHLHLARASRNRIMPLLLDPIHKLIPEIKSSVYETVGDARDSALIWHQKILDAVIKRDAKAARLAMEEHLTIAEEHAERMLAAQKETKS